MKKKILYGVIILNYNTPEDAVKAADSVVANATTDDFRIFIIDNHSTCDLSTLKSYRNCNAEVYLLDNNKGYAFGNNQGIQRMLEDYEPEFTVIMNPDVLLLAKGTIEGLISKYKVSDIKLAGVSPVVWNPNVSNDFRTQITASVAPSYKELFILKGGLAKYLFKNNFHRCTYMDKMPYHEDFLAESVSGAFFVMNTDIFKQIDFFDPNTFLYMEESIIGAKIKRIGYRFLVSPDYAVEHECGKSTKASAKSISKKSVQYGLDSVKVYMTSYLHLPQYKYNVYVCYVWLDYALKSMFYKVKSLLHVPV